MYILIYPYYARGNRSSAGVVYRVLTKLRPGSIPGKGNLLCDFLHFKTLNLFHQYGSLRISSNLLFELCGS